MMVLLVVILGPLAALFIYAGVSDLRRRRRRGAVGGHDISSAVRTTRADAEARIPAAPGGPGGGGLGGAGMIGGAGF